MPQIHGEGVGVSGHHLQGRNAIRELRHRLTEPGDAIKEHSAHS